MTRAELKKAHDIEDALTKTEDLLKIYRTSETVVVRLPHPSAKNNYHGDIGDLVPAEVTMIRETPLFLSYKEGSMQRSNCSANWAWNRRRRMISAE
jgi:hypothetical protein